MTIIPYRSEWADPLVALWNEASSDRYPIMPALWKAVTEGDPSFRPEDCRVMTAGDRPIAFALTKRLRETFPGSDRFQDEGYVALLGVAPTHQGQGVGRTLLADAEAHLKSEGARTVALGSSFHHVMPGVPAEADRALAFFERAGYALGSTVWDVRRDLGVEPSLPPIPEAEGVSYAPCHDPQALLTFLDTEFQGRWARDVGHYLATGGDPGAIMTVVADGAIAGFAWLHPPGSDGALRWAGFVPTMAALGPIGVGRAIRGRGLGLGLLVAGLRWLQDRGARETVIDWTTLLEFYGKAGFSPWLAYRLAKKTLA